VYKNKVHREVFSLKPEKHRGFLQSSKWLEWLKWGEAVQAIAVGVTTARGFVVSGWEEALCVRERDAEVRQYSQAEQV
jgi:hypothetical protein